MPPPDRPFGNDTLVVPCYLSTGPDDPGLAAWKREHPDWFEAGTWTPAPSRRRDQRSDAEREKLVAWMNETRALERAQAAAGRPQYDPAWAEKALRSATFPIGLPARPGLDFGGTRSDGAPEGDFELYPPQPQPSARVERISDAVDPITARIRDVDSQLHLLLATTFRERVASVDRSGSPAAFGSRLHKVLADVVRGARIPGVSTEASFIAGNPAEYGDPSSIRTDIVLRVDDQVVAVWDFKTGMAPSMPERRKQAIRDAIKSEYRGSNIPVDVLYEGFHQGSWFRHPWK